MVLLAGRKLAAMLEDTAWVTSTRRDGLPASICAPDPWAQLCLGWVLLSAWAGLALSSRWQDKPAFVLAIPFALESEA